MSQYRPYTREDFARKPRPCRCEQLAQVVFALAVLPAALLLGAGFGLASLVYDTLRGRRAE